MLQEDNLSFSSEYTDMRGIHLDLCTHHIYKKNESTPIQQPQWKMNPSLQNIVKYELHKLVNVNFIYPIFYS